MFLPKKIAPKYAKMQSGAKNFYKKVPIRTLRSGMSKRLYAKKFPEESEMIVKLLLFVMFLQIVIFISSFPRVYLYEHFNT